ncbi:hypothetical protein, partial [Pseudomonas aeruginosa]|uniref:hypothetical protein n=1 Tax=Pseudomonas aeruginosa TaxID=287 RepID=UPI001C3FA166
GTLDPQAAAEATFSTESASSSRSIVSIEPLAIQLPNQNFQARPAEIVLGLRKQHIPQTKLDFLFISLHPPWQIMR